MGEIAVKGSFAKARMYEFEWIDVWMRGKEIVRELFMSFERDGRRMEED